MNTRSTQKNKVEPVFSKWRATSFSKWRGNNWSSDSSKRASDPDHFIATADGVWVDRNSWKSNRMCMKGLPFFMWNLIIIYPLVSNIYREKLKISAIIGRLPVYVTAQRCTGRLKKLDLQSGSNAKHFVWFFSVPVQAPGPPFFTVLPGNRPISVVFNDAHGDTEDLFSP